MRQIRVGGRMLSLVALVTSISFASPSAAQPNANNTTFPCNSKNSKEQTLADPSSKHTITLSWNVSTSLSNPLALGEGYKLYRLNPDGSCTKINLYRVNPDGSYTKMNEDPIRGTVLEDRFVALGKTYRYAARAVKQNTESDPSNIAEVTIPKS